MRVSPKLCAQISLSQNAFQPRAQLVSVGVSRLVQKHTSLVAHELSFIKVPESHTVQQSPAQNRAPNTREIGGPGDLIAGVAHP